MESGVGTKVFHVKDMTCSSCELKIENALRKMEGVQAVKASLRKATVEVKYDAAILVPEELRARIQKLGYTVDDNLPNSSESKMSISQLLGIGIILFAVYWIIKSTVGFNFIPQIEKSVGYGMLFVIGLLTSLHCIAMCGGINLSQCVTYQKTENESKLAKFKPSLLYNSGRVISYTIVGGIVGAVGSVISFSGPAKGIVAIIGGLFMMIIGINMLNLFPGLKRFTIRMPKFFGNKVVAGSRKHGPFYIGLLNGLMPCGPLQTMQLYALGTGSFLAGATAMFLFSLGTVPLMFGFGAISSLLSGKFTQRMLKFSAVLVIILGLTMVSRGMSLSGISLAAGNPIVKNSGNVAQIRNGVQEVATTVESGKYQPITVQKGIPVRWTIHASAANLNGCNETMIIPAYNIQKKLVPGDNIIEFTPREEGTIPYSCWMGMIKSSITVVSNVNNTSSQNQNQIGPNTSASNTSPISGGSCCSAGASATRFQGGRVPTDDIQVAKIVNGVQEITIRVNDQGYSPAAVVVQKGLNVKLKFIPEKLSSCNTLVQFPEYQGQLDLSKGDTETPVLLAKQDFTFQCGMGMLHGYVKVVDNIKNIDINAIKKEISSFQPVRSSGGCCGG